MLTDEWPGHKPGSFNSTIADTKSDNFSFDACIDWHIVINIWKPLTHIGHFNMYAVQTLEIDHVRQFKFFHLCLLSLSVKHVT